MKTLAATMFGAVVLTALTAGPSQAWWQAWVDDDSYLTNRRNEYWFRDPYGRILPRQGYVAGGVFTSQVATTDRVACAAPPQFATWTASKPFDF